MNNSNFRKRLDSELEHIVFSAQKRSEILKRAEEGELSPVREPSPKRKVFLSGELSPLKERLLAFLNVEIRIPVRPLVIVLLITLSGLIYAGIGLTGVSAEEIKKSSITVVESKDGGQINDIYKN